MSRLRNFLFAANRPLQDRLAILIASAVAAAVAVTGIAAYAMTLLTVYDQFDNELVEVANITSGALSEDLENMGGIDTSAWQAANVIVMLVRSDAHPINQPGRNTTLVWGADEVAIARTAQGFSARTGVDSNGVPTRIVAVPLVDGDSYYALVIGRPLATQQAILQTTGLALLLFGGIGAAVAAAMGYFIAKSGMGPIRHLSDAVLAITETNKLTPIDVKGDDEVADLGRSFNRMLTALENSRERQKRLIADAGHELRTPLTSMRTNVELLVADERQHMLPEGARSEILRDVAAQLGEFTQLVGDLVQLSREEGVQPAPEPVDLRDIINSALDRVKRRGPGITWDVTLEPLIRFRRTRWEVTGERVFSQTGWLSRDQRIAPLSRVQTVDTHRGAVMRLFRLANVTVTTASAAGPITLHCLDTDLADRVTAELARVTGQSTGDAT